MNMFELNERYKLQSLGASLDECGGSTNNFFLNDFILYKLLHLCRICLSIIIIITTTTANNLARVYIWFHITVHYRFILGYY